MAKLIYKVVMTNTTKGHNKVWAGELYDNGVVITRWGPINGWERSTIYKKNKSAKEFLSGKMMEKENDDYVVVDTNTYEN